MADTPPANLPDAFTLEFDGWDDTICVPPIGDFIADQHPALKDVLTAGLPADPGAHLGADALLTALELIADGLPADTPDLVTDELEDATSSVRRHVNSDCGCSSDYWAVCEPAFDGLLSELSGTWAFYERGEALDDDTTDLGVTELKDLAMRQRDGFHALTVAWDGASELTARFASDSYHADITGYLLTGETAQLAERLKDCDVYLAHDKARTLPAGALEFAIDLYENFEILSDRLYVDDIITACATVWPLSDVQQEAIVALAPTWEQSAEDLIAAGSVVGLPAAA